MHVHLLDTGPEDEPERPRLREAEPSGVWKPPELESLPGVVGEPRERDDEAPVDVFLPVPLPLPLVSLLLLLLVDLD